MLTLQMVKRGNTINAFTHEAAATVPHTFLHAASLPGENHHLFVNGGATNAI